MPGVATVGGAGAGSSINAEDLTNDVCQGGSPVEINLNMFSNFYIDEISL